MEDRYLGDGVYASWDGFQIWLTTQTGDKIALEPEVFQELIKFNEDLQKQHG